MWSEALLFIAIAVCTVTDIRNRRIYNAVIFPCVFAGLLGHAITGGWAGLGFSFLGLLAGLSILLIPYLLGGMGAGDVKLLALIGALQGWEFAVASALFMGVIGGVMSILYLLFRKDSRIYLFRLLYAIAARIGRAPMPLPSSGGSFRIAMPYGIAIAAGAVMAWMWQGELLL